jgi:hypothetical protein
LYLHQYKTNKANICQQTYFQETKKVALKINKAVAVCYTMTQAYSKIEAVVQIS